MPREVKIEGIEEISRMLEQAGEKAEGIAAASLYEGAAIVADALAKSINEIQTAPFKYTASGTRLPSPEEKQVVAAGGHGIAKFDKNGSEVYTFVGMANSGYGEIAGKKVPVPLIARSIESGTSFMVKQPFFRKALNKSKRPASQAIVDNIDMRLQDMFGGK